MSLEPGREAATKLAAVADLVEWKRDRITWQRLLNRATRGRFGRIPGWPVVEILGAPWQDTPSPERAGWRQRAAILKGDLVFAVDYQVCRYCRLGWVEQPYTEQEFQRCGLAAAGLAAVRARFPGVSWHTLGGHLTESKDFWVSVGTEVPGGYRQRRLCRHVRPG